ncbi:D-alanyl-D-alanine carboxypeptidase family protein [Butyricicoccus sp.]|uniref:D-alanyl-D-alanine carboxypeptidase family protein n=1 Tax=Butyricicoccus sp. TaxID=2049021 RepID=UPI003735FC18
MKWNKKLGALLLSAALLAGTALPSLAEPEPADTETPAASQTQDTTDQTDTSPTAEGTDGAADTGTDASDDAQADTNEQQPAESTDTAAQPQNQTGAEAEDGSIQMPTITVDAKASILVNAETGEIIHANNEKEKQYPASCTKIMTALLALEKCSLDNVVTMKEEDFSDVNNGASNAGLKVGEQITVENLLYCLMLPSGNEAANALARTAAGSVDEFVQMMNDRAKELGCVNTHFANPNGLHSDNHYTCAYDLYLIAQQAMENSTFATVVNTAQKKLPATNKNPERIIYTTNQLILSSYSSIYYDNCYGIKTGHTSQAGYCLVSYAKQSGYTYYSVVLGAKDGSDYAGSFTETKRMFEWAFDNFRMQTATAGGSAVTECPVRLARGTDHVTLVTANDVPVLVPKGLDMSEMDIDISVEDSYDAPIAKGEKLGTVTYSYEGMECATADLVALTEINRSVILFVLDEIAKFFRLTAVRIIVGIVIAAFLLYLILSFIAGRNRRNRKKRRAQKRRKQRQNQNRR